MAVNRADDMIRVDLRQSNDTRIREIHGNVHVARQQLSDVGDLVGQRNQGEPVAFDELEDLGRGNPVLGDEVAGLGQDRLAYERAGRELVENSLGPGVVLGPWGRTRQPVVPRPLARGSLSEIVQVGFVGGEVGEFTASDRAQCLHCFAQGPGRGGGGFVRFSL